jgi:hypothetical protein
MNLVVQKKFNMHLMNIVISYLYEILYTHISYNCVFMDVKRKDQTYINRDAIFVLKKKYFHLLINKECWRCCHVTNIYQKLKNKILNQVTTVN